MWLVMTKYFIRKVWRCTKKMDSSMSCSRSAAAAGANVGVSPGTAIDEGGQAARRGAGRARGYLVSGAQTSRNRQACGPGLAYQLARAP